jgi:CheY-like chemotaxis protein
VKKLFGLIPNELNKTHVKLKFLGNPDHYFSKIIVDRQKLTQVFTNLIKNAFKFTNKGEVTYGYKTNNENQVIFFVKDTGIEIPPNKQQLIFEKFRQIEETETRSYGGSGLGLAICKEIVNLHNGKIWVDSELNKGSTFYFTLNAEIIDELNKTKTDNIIDNMIDLNGKTILVVEDEESNYDLIEILLKKTGAEVVHAENGMEALARIKENQNINLVLMDLRMPVMNGFEATKTIRKTNPKLPVIALTALAVKGDEARARQAGCTDYISKPIRKEKLYEVIGRYL